MQYVASSHQLYKQVAPFTVLFSSRCYWGIHIVSSVAAGSQLCEEVHPLVGYDNQACIELVQMYSEVKSSNCTGTRFKMASHFCRSVQQILWINSNSFSDRFQLVSFGAPIQFHGFIHHFSRAAIQTHGIVQDFLRGTNSTQICHFW